jgi:hypothetical protein
MPVTAWIFQNWQSFYALTGEAAATLVGLLFVALSFGEGVISDSSQTAKLFRIWVEPTLYDFVQVLALSVLAEMPVLPPAVFGGLFFVHMLFRLGRWREILKHFRGPEAPADLERADWIEQLILPGLSYAVGLITAVGLCLASDWGPLGLAVYVLLMLLLGINNTWNQFAWMASEKIKRRSAKRKR